MIPLRGILVLLFMLRCIVEYKVYTGVQFDFILNQEE